MSDINNIAYAKIAKERSDREYCVNLNIKS